jgi:hypothetical protein
MSRVNTVSNDNFCGLTEVLPHNFLEELRRNHEELQSGLLMSWLRLKSSNKEYRFKPTSLIALIYNYGEALRGGRGGKREG